MFIIYLYYFLIVGLFIALAYWYGHKTKEWRWSEYFLMTLAPFAGMIFLAWLEGFKIIIFFILSGLVGLTGEFVLGFSCDKILGRKLWRYSKLSLSGYTSLLTLPFWGGAGILFLILAKLLSL